jgi:hypothetical protein
MSTEQLTLDSIKNKPYAEVIALVKNPATYPQMEAILRTPKGAAWMSELISKHNAAQNQILENAAALDETDESAITALAGDNDAPSTEEIAAESQAAVDEANVVAAATAQQAEEARLASYGILVLKDQAGNIVRYVQEYQITDANTGKPLGRPTHLEAPTLAELIVKQRDTHSHATQALFQSRAANAKFKAQQEAKTPPVILTDEQVEAIAKEAIETGDIAKAKDFVRSRLDEETQKKILEAQKAAAYANGQAMAMEFYSRHIADFYRCDANKQLIADYINEAGIGWSLETMELAFDVVRDKLVHPPQDATLPAAPANIPAAATVPAVQPVNHTASVPAATVEPSVVPASPAVQAASVSAPQTTPTVPNPVHTVRRAGVDAGIAPGTLSAKRPVVVPAPRLTKDQIKAMSAAELRQNLKNAQFVKDFEALGYKS